MNEIMNFFEYTHLPPRIKEVSKSIAEVANLMNDAIPQSEEKSVGLRKLLEAKDCFVRASLDLV